MTNQWNAAEYDAKHKFVYEKAKGLVELLAPKAGERILDLGCGTGALTAESRKQKAGPSPSFGQTATGFPSTSLRASGMTKWVALG